MMSEFGITPAEQAKKPLISVSELAKTMELELTQDELAQLEAYSNIPEQAQVLNGVLMQELIVPTLGSVTQQPDAASALTLLKKSDLNPIELRSAWARLPEDVQNIATNNARTTVRQFLSLATKAA